MRASGGSISKSIPRAKVIYWGGAFAFVALVMFMLTYSLPVITNLPLIIAIIFLLTLYSILYPMAAPFIPQKIAYFGHFFASLFGLEIAIIYWLLRIGMLTTFVALSSIFMAWLVLALVHYRTRRGLVIHRKFLYGGLCLDLKRVTRVGEMLITPFFLVMSVSFSNPGFINLPTLSVLIVVSSLIGTYLSFSILALNVTYRTRRLNQKLGTKDFASKIGDLETALLKKYSQRPNTVEFFSFVLRSVADDFMYGDYERSYLDSYRIIHDKIIESPKTIVEKVIDPKTLEEYRRIRIFLVHGYLKEKGSKLEKPINVSDVVGARKMLFDKTLDLINSAFAVAAGI